MIYIYIFVVFGTCERIETSIIIIVMIMIMIMIFIIFSALYETQDP